MPRCCPGRCQTINQHYIVTCRYQGVTEQGSGHTAANHQGLAGNVLLQRRITVDKATLQQQKDSKVRRRMDGPPEKEES